jgi:hypothetical protein
MLKKYALTTASPCLHARPSQSLNDLLNQANNLINGSGGNTYQ